MPNNIIYAFSPVGSSGLNPILRSFIHTGLCLTTHRIMGTSKMHNKNQEDPAVKPEEGACGKKKYQSENQTLDYDCDKHLWIDSAHILCTFTLLTVYDT
ncbi:MAG TPA: hypothetical protein VEF35_00520 [Candidatus Bathyarchaeia archaeon]|nr:hypothetical protein [Candidatus Bathyarchaeia archaeon]